MPRFPEEEDWRVQVKTNTSRQESVILSRITHQFHLTCKKRISKLASMEEVTDYVPLYQLTRSVKGKQWTQPIQPTQEVHYQDQCVMKLPFQSLSAPM